MLRKGCCAKQVHCITSVSGMGDSPALYQNYINIYTCRKVIQQSMEQPGMVANPARGQLNRGNVFSALSTFAPENNVVPREKVRPSRPASVR